jgi:hypothetical protein
MAKTLGWLVFAALAITLTINSVCMLFVPKVWLRLPQWLNSASSSFRERYASERGMIGIRMTGAVFLAGMAWVAYDYFSR